MSNMLLYAYYVVSASTSLTLLYIYRMHSWFHCLLLYKARSCQEREKEKVLERPNTDQKTKTCSLASQSQLSAVSLVVEVSREFLLQSTHRLVKCSRPSSRLLFATLWSTLITPNVRLSPHKMSSTLSRDKERQCMDLESEWTMYFISTNAHICRLSLLMVLLITN